MKRYLRMLREEFHGYSLKSLSADLLAGITVAAVALPLALAFGVSSGADAAAGLITAIIAGLVIGTLSGGYYQISGPTGAMAAILMAISARYGLNGVFLATFMAGALLLLAGLFKLGKITSFIPMPVITGFTSGIAVIIALGQVDNLFGVVSQGESTVQKLLSYSSLGFNINWMALGLGVFVMLVMFFYPKKWNAVIPGSLVGIVLATLACVLLKLPVQTVGTIPQTLLPEQRLTLSGFDPTTISGLLSPAVSIAILGMIESLLCGASAGRMTGKRLDSNQELIAQGIGNMVLPFLGGIPATAAIARTSVAIKSGAKTRLTGIFHAVALLVFMLVLAPVMSMIPLCALAGVLIVTAWRMNETHAIAYIFKNRLKSSMLMFLATMLATIVFDLTAAILIGVGIAIICMISRMSQLEIYYDKIHTDRIDGLTQEQTGALQRSSVVYIYGPILFANAQMIEDIAVQLTDTDHVYLSMRGVSDMDISGAQAFSALLKVLHQRNIAVTVTGLPSKTKVMFDRCGLTERIGSERLFTSVDRAIQFQHCAEQDVTFRPNTSQNE